MKTSPAPQRRRGKADRPKSRVHRPKIMWVSRRGAFWSNPFGAGEQPVLVLPCASKKSARKRLAFERLTFEEKMEAMAEEMHTDWRAAHGVPGCERWETLFENEKEPYRRSARAILHLLGEGEEKP